MTLNIKKNVYIPVCVCVADERIFSSITQGWTAVERTCRAISGQTGTSIVDLTSLP